ncbi:MAG: WD40 repeat domain-containing protein [Chloroflexi bacterium]|nr:MAG: hypothetical protein CUN54_04840 [Phototrophicales bacterium]RMF82366.1 MAG: WD40 repeat domain-containing protein [Chloroflexota bacterium]
MLFRLLMIINIAMLTSIPVSAFQSAGGVIQITRQNADAVTILDVVAFNENIASIIYPASGTDYALASDFAVQVWDYARLALLNQGIQVSGRIAGLSYFNHNQTDSLAIYHGAGEEDGAIIEFWDRFGTQQQSALHLQNAKGQVVAHFLENTPLLATYDAFGANFAINIWDIRDGSLLHTFDGHTREILGLDFAAGSERLISYARDNTIRVWNLRTGAEEIFFTHEDVLNVDYNAAKNLLVSGSVNDVRLWDVDTGEAVAVLPHETFVADVAFNADATLLATIDGNNIHLWDAETGAERMTLTGHESSVSGILFSPDNDLLVSYDNPFLGMPPSIRLWDVSTGNVMTIISIGTESNIADVSFSPDGSTLMVLSGGGVLLYGVPSDTRPAAGTIPARIIPSSVNLRSAPSSAAEAFDVVFSQVVLVSGRDVTGQFVYLPEFDGWVRAGSTYIDLKGIPLETLPIVETG